MKLINDIKEAEALVEKWQEILRLRDWDIRVREVKQEWRKTGDIKIAMEDKRAILMLNCFNPKDINLEALIVHEMLHLKLWGMDQMIEQLLNIVFGDNPDDPKYEFAFTKFMEILEPTVEDLTKGFIQLGGENKEMLFGRLEREVEEELGKGAV